MLSYLYPILGAASLIVAGPDVQSRIQIPHFARLGNFGPACGNSFAVDPANAADFATPLAVSTLFAWVTSAAFLRFH
jgi:hypothetical protein